MDGHYIKFFFELTPGTLHYPAEVAELNRSRDALHSRGLIGVTPDGIGFGNISVRIQEGKFLISGSNTGKLKRLGAEHCVLIEETAPEENKVFARGQWDPSSESLSHAAFYEARPEIKAVVHVHDDDLWKRSQPKFPVTSAKVTYGTPGMAAEIQRCLREGDFSRGPVIVTAGHAGGLFAFGATLDEATRAILAL